MSRYTPVNSSPAQQNKILFQMTEIALSDSASLLSELAQKKVDFSLDNIVVGDQSGLPELLNSVETAMFAVCHRLDGANHGCIAFLLDEPDGLNFVKALLYEKNDRQDMTEMEEEALIEVGNIIINDLLRHYMETLQEAVTTSVPTLKRGQYNFIFERSVDGVTIRENYLAKFSVEVLSYTFFAYILWIDYLHEQEGENSKRLLKNEPL